MIMMMSITAATHNDDHDDDDDADDDDDDLQAEQAKVQLGLLASQGDPRAKAMLEDLKAQGLI